MFRHVPACSGMFGVPGFIDGHFDTEMSNKCLVLIISVAFVGVTLYTLLIASPRRREEKRREEKRRRVYKRSDTRKRSAPVHGFIKGF